MKTPHLSVRMGSIPALRQPQCAVAAAAWGLLLASASAQQFAELHASAQQPTALASECVSAAFADVDGDGDLDLFMGRGSDQNHTYAGGHQNLLWRNDGSGAFVDVTATALPVDMESTEAVAFGDVDGDGDIDIVCGNAGWNGAQNRLYLNDGLGQFVDATANLPVRIDYTTSLALGDVDGDGDLDLVVGSAWSQDQLYLNDGQGGFVDATATHLPATSSSSTRSVQFGDVDGDGDLDLVMGCGDKGVWVQAGPQNRLYLNDGTGTFADATAQLPVDMDNTFHVELGDVDGDGDLDCVCGNGLGGVITTNAQDRLYVNDGTGNFTDATILALPVDGEHTESLALADLDGDGDLDLLVGKGRISPAIPATPQNGVRSWAITNRIYINNGVGGFQDVTNGYMAEAAAVTHTVQVADLDGDGDLDAFFGNVFGLRSEIQLNVGGLEFAPWPRPAIPHVARWATACALADVDADGDLDLLVGATSDWPLAGTNPDVLCLNDGYGNFLEAPATQWPVTPSKTNAVQFGDVDQDGDLDVVSAGSIGLGGNGNAAASILSNNGAGSFSPAPVGSLVVQGGAIRGLAFEDVDADGDLDLVTAQDGQNHLYLNNGFGVFVDVTASHLPTASDATKSVSLGDVDGDGDLDVLFGNGWWYAEQDRLYLNDGTGAFSDATAQLPAAIAFTSFTQFADIDLDGDLDIVMAGDNRVYVNNGAGTFADETATRLPAGSGDATLVVGDIDNDGDLDILFGRDGVDRLFLNNGAGVYQEASASRFASSAYPTTALALGDVDHDGDLDLVASNGVHYEGLGRLSVNLLRQLHTSALVRPGQPFHLDAYARYGVPGLVDVALPYFSLAPASIAVPSLGTLGLDPLQMLALPPFVIPQPAGVATLTLTVPNIAALAGNAIYAQAVMLPWPAAATLSNVTKSVIVH